MLYTVSETGIEPYVARDETELVRYAMDFRGSHGPFSGMEDWDSETVREWLAREAARLAVGETDTIRLYAPHGGGYEFNVNRKEP